jgi:formylglycine-generating enzyme required for sulfatase activity
MRTALTESRAQSDALFDLVRPEALFDRPVPERHRIVFYLGHLEAFDWNLLSQASAIRSFEPQLDQLFSFGIDPAPGHLPQDVASDWPTIERVQEYVKGTRLAVDGLLSDAPVNLVFAALEHRLMHQETLAYLLHDLPLSKKRIPRVVPSPSGVAPVNGLIEVPAGETMLGQRQNFLGSQYPFAWDNEFLAHRVTVARFAMNKHKVSNEEYLQFVRAGAKPPHFWKWHEGQWYWRGMWGEVPLPLDWPVYVTQTEASSFAAWTGKRLPTEAEFHRAGYGIPGEEVERSYPWGEHHPDTQRGNFNEIHWDPVPVTATPLGDSAFGFSQLVGNGWEWTSTIFQPFPGFQPQSFYPEYSTRFFDGEHYVLKGASSRTDHYLLRRSFRNWFRPDYPYVYAGFRCVEA